MKNPFNSAFEAGVRTLAILAAAYPSLFDMHRLVIFDYLVVHSGDAEGPQSLHPPIPLRSGELLVRRQLIERGALLMSSRGLIERRFLSTGMFFVASDNAAPFLSSLHTDYLAKLLTRANWAVQAFGDLTTPEINKRAANLIKSWAPEFEVSREPGRLL